MKMLGNRPMAPIIAQDNPLWISWHDTQMMAALSPATVMDYFCRKSNPFYDRVCNNETIRMQRLSPEHLNNMVGIEFILLHVAEPILYVIRKQHRHSPTEATPLADYYIIGGMVYKAPDLASVVNSRVLSTVTNLQAAFEETSQYMRYNPNKGYTWDFSGNKALSDKARNVGKKDVTPAKEDTMSVFQMQRIDMLLAETVRRFPPPVAPIVHQQHMQQLQQQQQQQMQQSQPQMPTIKQENTNGVPEKSNNHMTDTANNGVASPATLGTLEPKQEPVDMKPPPEKKPKLN